MPSATNRQGISHCLESGHPVNYFVDELTCKINTLFHDDDGWHATIPVPHSEGPNPNPDCNPTPYRL